VLLKALILDVLIISYLCKCCYF